ncbi:hypothetical protein NM688_g3794 [Phlebia brevispora]|uniref:Uncharacterized protein n=1 Tax=Phlebia brevispora TaxID=194682 RepID=A0ACC1T4R4_9APHY|nr:hypothetical protein NM688_g3794 [Phlebia brevispora]
MGLPSSPASVSGSFDILIFDLGDVLFEWSLDVPTAIPPKEFRRFLHSAAWFDYEKGLITEDKCYSVLSQELALSVTDVEASFRAIRESLKICNNVLNLIQELKPGHRVFAMSNMAAPSWEFIRKRFPECDVFEHVFTSAAAGERKPNLGFYRHVLQQTGVDPRHAVFIDDQLQNVITARSFGMKGIVYEDYSSLERILRNLLGDPIERAWAFMRANTLHHLSYTSVGNNLNEHFTPLLILEATGDPSLVEYTPADGPWTFFPGETEYTTTLPPDVDSTSLAYTIVPHTVPDDTKHRVMDEILVNRTSDGIVQVYFGDTRPRVDAAVCVNVLHMFYTYDRGDDVKETFEWIHAVLETRAYIDGTRYYTTAEVFLYFLSRLVCGSSEVRERIGALYKERCRERIGIPGDALAFAMRVICCAEQGLDATVDAEKLQEMQEPDGSWSDGWFYHYPIVGLTVANRGLTTALAMKALKLVRGM